MSVSVTIDGLIFHGDGDSLDWIYEHLAGWYSGPPMRGGSDDRPNADGEFSVDRAFRSARPLKFSGTLTADSAAEAISRWMQFAAIQSDGRPFPLTVVDPFGTLTATVSLDGAPDVLEITNEGAEVGARFIAYDPVKYGPARTVSTGLPTSGGGLEYPLGSPSGALYYGALGGLGRVVLTNVGTAETWPTFEITGELTDGFYLQCLESGDVLRYERVVPAGTSVSLDARTGEVLVDGISDGSTYLVRDEWFSAAPGGVCTVQFNAIGASSGSPLLSATISDGFW